MVQLPSYCTITWEMFMAGQAGRFKSFDTLKFIAVLLCTTIGHYFQFTQISYQPVCETRIMTAIVRFLEYLTSKHTHSLMELLFLVGGFQLYLSYHDRIKVNSITFFEYFKKRFVRLYPPMVISVIVMSVGVLLYKAVVGTEWRGVFFLTKAFVMSILGIQAWTSDIHVLNGPLWYLSVYILCVIIYYPLERVSAKYKMGILTMFIPVIMALCHFFNPTAVFMFLHMDVCRGLYGFFLGTVFAAAYKYFSRNQITISGIPMMVVGIALYVMLNEQILLDPNEGAIIMTMLVWGPMVALLALYPKLDEIVGFKPLSFLGKTSIHLYCINFPFLLWMSLIPTMLGYALIYDSFYIFVMFIALQIGLSVLMYYLIDKKFVPYFAKAIEK